MNLWLAFSFTCHFLDYLLFSSFTENSGIVLLFNRLWALLRFDHLISSWRCIMKIPWVESFHEPNSFCLSVKEEKFGCEETYLKNRYISILLWIKRLDCWFLPCDFIDEHPFSINSNNSSNDCLKRMLESVTHLIPFEDIPKFFHFIWIWKKRSFVFWMKYKYCNKLNKLFKINLRVRLWRNVKTYKYMIKIFDKSLFNKFCWFSRHVFLLTLLEILSDQFQFSLLHSLLS